MNGIDIISLEEPSIALDLPLSKGQANLWKIFTSPLITSIAIAAIAMAVLPWLVSTILIGFTVAFVAICPQKIPRRLLYEIAVIDLVVREKLSQWFPSLAQHWWHPIVPGLFLGGVPLSSHGHLDRIQGFGVRAIFSILEEDEANFETFFSIPLKERDWLEAKIEYYRLSCPDMTAMSIEELHRAVEWIHNQISSDLPVLLHCKAGRGRSAMVAVAYLMSYCQMSLEEAIAYVKAKRAVVGFNSAQRARLQEYALFLQNPPQSVFLNFLDPEIVKTAVRDMPLSLN